MANRERRGKTTKEKNNRDCRKLGEVGGDEPGKARRVYTGVQEKGGKDE